MDELLNSQLANANTDPGSEQENDGLPEYKLPELFLDRDARGVAIAGGIVLLITVAITWVTVPENDRSFSQITTIMLDLAKFTGATGWSVLALAVALVAISITTVAIAGIRRTEEFEGDRHRFIMKSAEVFILVALGFLAWFIAASVISVVFVALGLGPEDEDLSVIELVVLASAAVALWMSTRALYGYLHRVVLSDSDRRQKDLAQIQSQRKDVEDLTQAARAAVTRLQKTKGSDETMISLRCVITRAILLSILAVGIVAGIAGLLVCMSNSDSGESERAFSSFWSVFTGVGFLAAVQMVFVVAPYVWSVQLWKTEEPGSKKIVKFIGLIIVSSPVALIIFLSAIIGFFTGAESAPMGILITFSVFIILPSLVSVFFPRGWSWHAVSAVNAFRQNNERLAWLKSKEQHLLDVQKQWEASGGNHETLESDSKQIIALLQQLVDAQSKSQPDSERVDPEKRQQQSCLKALQSFFRGGAS